MADTATLILRVRNDKYNRGLSKSEKYAKKLAKANREAKKSALALSAGLAVAAFGVFKISKALAQASKEALKFSRRMAEVSTLMPDAAPRDLKILEEGILDLSAELGFLTKDSVPALYQAISASVPRDNVLEFLKVAGKAAVGGVTSLENAVDGLTSVVNAYGLESKDASRVADIFFETVKRGKTTFSELSQGIGLVAPLANAAGVSIEELFGIIASLTKQGLRTDTALTGIRGTMTALLNPNEKLTALMAELATQGKNVEVKSAGALNVLKTISTAVNNDTKAIAKLIPNVRGLNAVLALLQKGGKGTKEDIDAMTKSLGASGAAFKKMQDDPSQNAKTLAADFEQLTKALGDLVNETGIVKFLAKVASGLNAIAKEAKKDVGMLLAIFDQVHPFGEGYEKFLGMDRDHDKGIKDIINQRYGGAEARAPKRGTFGPAADKPRGDGGTAAWLKTFEPGSEESKKRAEQAKKSLEAIRAENMRIARFKTKELEAEERQRVSVLDRIKSLKNEARIQKLILAGKKKEAFIQGQILAAGRLSEKQRTALRTAAGDLYDLQNNAGAAAGPVGPSSSLASAMARGSAEAVSVTRGQHGRNPEEKTAKNTESIDKTLKRSLSAGNALVTVNLGGQ